jgi:hypothetical protein
MTELIRILETFLSKGDWSIANANELEGQLADYSEVPGVSDLQDILASYRPGGGEYLYDKEKLEKEILFLIESLQGRSK